MANKLFQKLIDQMKDIIGKEIAVIDGKSKIIASTNYDELGKKDKNMPINQQDTETSIKKKKNSYKIFEDENLDRFYVRISGIDEQTLEYVELLAVTFSQIKEYYDDKHDTKNFIKNIILENLMPGEIYVRAQELEMNIKSIRVVYSIKIDEINIHSAYEELENLFPKNKRDFIFNINENELILVKEIENIIHEEALEALAETICDTFRVKFSRNVLIGIGTPVKDIKKLSMSYKEAKTALEVGRVFEDDKNVSWYGKLGIARLIYQLPKSLCHKFLNEIMSEDSSIEDFDDETLFTINEFFKCDLNVSETARKLFIHRNTLVYRLDKIKNKTGFNIRNFDQAVKFKFAIMVKKYLNKSGDYIS